MNFSPVFGTGLARSGGALYSLCLSTNPAMMVACCPNLELFRSFRNAVLREHGTDAIRAEIPPSAALQDYYGTDMRTAALDLIMDADLDVPFAAGEWTDFHSISVARGDLEAADLTPHYDRLKGASYGDVFRNLLDIIADSRQSGDRQWVGFHEAWALDAYPALARTFPDARFLVMFRDPRAIVNSMLGVERIDPSQVAQVLSYARHWRKYAALALHYSQMPLFKGRLHLTAHDLVLTRPRQTIAAICKSFDVAVDERMFDTNNYYDYATKRIWSGNSSFEGKTEGISAHRALRWREQLDPKIQKTIEYLCGPDLRMVGYPTYTPFADTAADADPEITAFLLKDLAGYANWRSDLRDPVLDLGLEAVRRQLLRLPEPCVDTRAVRKTFLFDEVYAALRNAAPPLLPALAEAL
jgi:hypothetical protein